MIEEFQKQIITSIPEGSRRGCSKKTLSHAYQSKRNTRYATIAQLAQNTRSSQK